MSTPTLDLPPALRAGLRSALRSPALPAPPALPTPRATLAPPAPLARASEVSGRLLIVDDPRARASALRDALVDAGYAVLRAGDADAALQCAAQAHPDLVLIESLRSHGSKGSEGRGGGAGGDGYELARRLQAGGDTAHIPIVFVSARTDSAQVVAAFDAGGIDCIGASIGAPELLARIAAHLRVARLARQARNALDAFGHATLALQLREGGAQLVWQTPLARRWLPDYFGVRSDAVPVELLQWLRAAAAGGDVRPLVQARPAQALVDAAAARCSAAGQLVCTLQGRTVDDDWLVVLREVGDASRVHATMQSLRLTLRESEVLYWVTQGKTNRDIGDILGSSPATVKKHLERVYEKLGVETRTAAAAVALRQVPALARG